MAAAPESARPGVLSVPDNTVLMVAAFAMVSSLILLVFMLVNSRRGRLQERLRDLSDKPRSRSDPANISQLARTTLPKMGAALVPSDDEERTRLQARLVHAGIYGRQGMLVFLGVKLVLIVAPAVIGFALGLLDIVPMTYALLLGCVLGIVGVIGPGFWLDARKGNRQTNFRRALPDALDVIVICLEGGLSLPAAIRRVSVELRTAHPLLARELDIVQREVQLGLSTGEALRKFAGRADLEDLRSLASVILQSERFGASLVKALRVHAETLRQKRLQYAEEMAQKASTKVLFPTILFILPCVFVVILAPGLIQLGKIFSSVTK